MGFKANMNPEEVSLPVDKIEQAERKLAGECIWCEAAADIPISRHHIDCIDRLRHMAGIK